MLVCPECQGELAHSATERGYFWTCPGCGGRVLGLAVLRKEAGDEFAQRVALEARRAQGGLGRPCPMCSNYLVKAAMGAGTEAYDLEICPACQSVWVSQAAYRRLPFAAPPAPQPAPAATAPAVTPLSPMRPIPAPMAGPTAPPPASLPQQGPAPGPTAGYRPAQSGPSDRIVLTEEQQERIAAVYAQTVANQMNSRYRNKANWHEPEALWQRVLGHVVPVICDTKLSSTPRVTWTLAALISVVSLIALYATNMNITVMKFGFIPAQPFRYLGLTFLTHFLLHGGWTHLLFNLYFLMAFGSSVEDRLGPGRYLALVLTAAVVGATLHAALEPNAQMPAIGASGGIAGLVVFFGLTFPRAKLAFVMWISLFYRPWIKIPALVWVVFWLLSQIMGARAQIMGSGDVSYLGHIGGALVGFIFWLVCRFTKEEDQDITASPADAS